MSNVVLDRPAGESRASRGRPFYLALDPDPVFAVVHAPDEGSRTGTGVVFSPPVVRAHRRTPFRPSSASSAPSTVHIATTPPHVLPAGCR